MDTEKYKQMTFENSLAIAQLIEISKRTSEDIDKMIKHSEKLNNISIEQSKILGRVGHLENVVSNDKKKIKLVYSIMEYPKASFSLFVGAWSLTFYEVRAAIGIQLQPLVDMITYIKGVL